MKSLILLLKRSVLRVLYIFRNPTKQMYNRLANQATDERQVDGYVHSYDSPEVEELLQKLTGRIRQLFADGKVDTVLDAGCGTGRYIAALADDYSSKSFYGFDFSNQTIELHCKKRGLDAEFAEGDLQKPNPWPNVRFDLIYSIGVLQYIEPKRLKLVGQNFADAQNAGGLLMICFAFDAIGDKQSRLGFWWHNPAKIAEDWGAYYKVLSSAPLDIEKSELGWVFLAERK